LQQRSPLPNARAPHTTRTTRTRCEQVFGRAFKAADKQPKQLFIIARSSSSHREQVCSELVADAQCVMTDHTPNMTV